MRKHFFGERKAGGVTDLTAGLHFSEYARIVCRITQHNNIFVIFCRGAQHGRATDVDVFDRVFERTLRFGHGLLKRIQIDYHHVDGCNIVLGQRCHVGRKIAPRQYAAVHSRMQSLDATIKHFGKAGVVGYFSHVQTLLGQ